MAVSESRSPTPNVVDGFSRRFSVLLDQAGLPKANRASIVARRFDVALNTAKNWCAADRIPQSHSDLVRIVEDLLQDVATKVDSRAVIGWLIAGDAVPHPFGDDGDSLRIVELYLEIGEYAKRQGQDFNKLPRNVRRMILGRMRVLSSSTAPGDGQPLLSGSALDVLAGMLATAKEMSPS